MDEGASVCQPFDAGQAGLKVVKKEEKALVGLVLEFYSTNGLVSTLL